MATRPLTDAIDIVRLKIGDTDENDEILTDQEIKTFLEAVDDNTDIAAALCCDSIAAKFARQVDFTTDGQSFSLSQRAAAYRTLAQKLRGGSGGYSIPAVSSISAASADAENISFGE